MQSLKERFTTTQVMAPAARTTTFTSSAIDLANVEHNVLYLEPGTLTDGTFTPKLQECATSGGSYTDVAAADLDGTFAAVASNTIQKVAYIGALRYVKLVVTATGSPATGVVMGATLVQKNRKLP